MYKNEQEVAYSDDVANTSTEERPELTYLLERVGYEIQKIHEIKYELIRKGHEIKDTSAPEKVSTEDCERPAMDVVSILSNYVESLSSIKESLHLFNKKLNSLI